MNKVYLDLGNTALKVFNSQGDLIETYLASDVCWIDRFKSFIALGGVEQAVLASVAVKEKEVAVMGAMKGLAVTKASCEKGSWKIQHSYKQPHRLGIDRLLAIEAAYREVNDRLVVIDCGSAITLDSVDADGFHLGGFIVPGYRLQMESLLNGTNLTFDAVEPAQDLGNDTSECIRNGSLRMITSLCESVIKECNPSKVILTGGDVNGVLSSLRSLGGVDKLLVFKGLKYVYG